MLEESGVRSVTHKKPYINSYSKINRPLKWKHGPKRNKKAPGGLNLLGLRLSSKKKS